MSYQVLARKWRPRHFEEVAGQEHILRALIHALDTQRLHHAYLFTGTRGVGKTTIARILAKCFTCESGISSKPCTQCNICQEIDTGRFVDLIEVDAASRTKVEDTRELLDNVQYAPTQGRFKIYLIDEVHMLSGHSFNALLKTLEEPPQHVKFLLATTDPQKLPPTILSRCLQFNLKKLNIQQLSHYLQLVLTKENIPFEVEALRKIARAATGSMRDALSLLDQAIAFSHGNINVTDIHAMLGTIEQNYIEKLLYALAAQDGKQLLDITVQLAEQGTDFNSVLEELISTLHVISIAQIVPEAIHEEYNTTMISELSQQFSKEELQLYYQIVLLGRRDLPLANDPQTGFEMILLRLLAFRPATSKSIKEANTHQIISKQIPDLVTTTPAPILISDWPSLLAKLDLPGITYTLASGCTLKTVHNTCIELTLNSKYSNLLNEENQTYINEALNRFFNQKIQLIIHINETTSYQKNGMDEQHQSVIKTLSEDPNIQAMIDKFGTVIDPELVKLI